MCRHSRTPRIIRSLVHIRIIYIPIYNARTTTARRARFVRSRGSTSILPYNRALFRSLARSQGTVLGCGGAGALSLAPSFSSVRPFARLSRIDYYTTIHSRARGGTGKFRSSSSSAEQQRLSLLVCVCVCVCVCVYMRAHERKREVLCGVYSRQEQQ